MEFAVIFIVKESSPESNYSNVEEIMSRMNTTFCNFIRMFHSVDKYAWDFAELLSRVASQFDLLITSIDVGYFLCSCNCIY